MRTFVLFALALGGLAAVTDDASAGPFRRKGRASSDCGCGGGGYASPAGYSGGYMGGSMGGRVGSAGAYTGPYFDGASYYVQGSDGRYYSTTTGQMMGGQMMGGQMMGGRAAMIRTTDGQSYTLGTDGSYYPTSAMGWSGQEYSGMTNRATTSFYPSGVYPAGMYGSNGGVYPAGGSPIPPRPGTPTGFGPGNGTVPAPMPPQK
jgi:hypothetical protein